MENHQASIGASSTAEGLPKAWQAPLLFAISAKLDVMKRFLHLQVALNAGGRKEEGVQALQAITELEEGSRAGNADDLSKLVAMVTMMEPDLPRMQALLTIREPAQLVAPRPVFQPTLSLAYSPTPRQQGFIRSMLDWIF